MDNVNGTQVHMGNVKEMEILRTKKMLGIKNTVKEIKNVYERLMSRLDMAEESISELENISIGTSKPTDFCSMKQSQENEKTSQRMGRKYLQKAYLIKDCYPKHTQNSSKFNNMKTTLLKK